MSAPDRRVAARRYMEVFGVRLNPQVLPPGHADRRHHRRRPGDGRANAGLFQRDGDGEGFALRGRP